MSKVLQTLYGYHAWANADLLEKLVRLEASAHAVELHASIRLINHSYVVARIFAAHLTGSRHDYASDNTEATPALSELRNAVAASDRWYLNYVRTVSAGDLAECVPFVFTDGDKGYMAREEMLMHVALHAGYHRGEAGRILTQLSVSPPWDTLAVFLHQSEPQRRLQQGQVGEAA